MSFDFPTLAIFVIILALYMPGVQIAATFDPERVRVLDRTDTSILARGNAPLNRHGMYDPEMILSHLNKRFAKEEEQQHFDKLVIVSLISSRHSDEERVLLKQRDFYKGPQRTSSIDSTALSMGSFRHVFLHRPVVGSWVALPILTNMPVINQLVWKYLKPSDGGWELSNELKSLLNRSRNTAIYIHCMRGMDRTGLVSGTYLARWKHKTTQEVNMANFDVTRRQLNWPARVGLHWISWKVNDDTM